jgi:heme-degrading monooxygenase HmoA
MWVRMTYFRMDLANIEAARTFYNGEEISGVMRRQPGYRFNYLLESVDAPGEAISVSAWDSREAAEAYERSGVYEELIGRFGEYYVQPPELRNYEIPE